MPDLISCSQGSLVVDFSVAAVLWVILSYLRSFVNALNYDVLMPLQLNSSTVKLFPEALQSNVVHWCAA